MDQWNPKPLKDLNHGLFKLEHPEVVVKGRNALERQRDMDGTPITTGNKTVFVPQDAKLTLKDVDMKTDRVAKGKSEAPEVDASKETDSVADPDERLKKAREIIKSYMMSAKKNC